LFPGSTAYWEQRYRGGGNSGAGSYGNLARFKAETLNALVRHRHLQSVIEFGCGDGNQLSLFEFPHYIGLDISRTALIRCIDRFRTDRSKSFFLYDPLACSDNQRLFHADVSLSLDVIYHLVEDSVFDQYMRALFHAADRCVVVYSSNFDDNKAAAHVRHRRFTDWASCNAPRWTLATCIQNQYPFDPRQSDETSLADFYVFERRSS
jgi:SAM-dependent methyltransferase